MDTPRFALPARAVVRPNSARHAVGTSSIRRQFQLPSTPPSTPLKRPLTARPRPPLASTALVTTLTHRQRHLEPHIVANVGVAPSVPREDTIAPQIMREEIETQRKVSHKAQRELNALRVQRVHKQQEIERLQRHLRAFDVASYSPPKPREPPTRVAELRNQIRRMDAYKKTLRTMLDRLARHLHFMRANMELLAAQHASAAKEWTLFQDKVVQEKSLGAELEHKNVLVIQERIAHAQHTRQLLDSLREEIRSRSLVNHQRQEADKRRDEMLKLLESRPPAVGGAATTTSPSSSVQSLDEPRSPPMAKRGSPGRCDSVRIRLRMEESRQFFGGQAVVSSDQQQQQQPVGLLASTSTSTSFVSASSRHSRLIRNGSMTSATNPTIAAMGENRAAVAQRDALFQLYETHYNRVLAQTGESDLAVVRERFKSYDDTSQRLLQIEKELQAEHQALDTKRLACDDHLWQLRLSGTAEVEKRKKIRDFLEQQHHFQSVRKCQAKDDFVAQLKTLSYVQQGVLTITELLKCLDDKFTPPVCQQSQVVAIGAGRGSQASGTCQIDWLLSLAVACKALVKAQPWPPVVFTDDQILRLAQIDATLGGAAGAWGSSYDTLPIESSRATRDNDDDRTSQGGSGHEDSDEEVEDRSHIKRNEAETLQQAELLFRTLDSRQQMARQEQSMARLRWAFGLGSVVEESASAATSLPSPNDPADRAAKLAAVHAFFKEKRLCEKQEQRDSRADASQDRAMAVQRSGHVSTSASPNASVMMASIMATHRSSSASKTAIVALSAFGKPQRKRSNGVSFILPVPTNPSQHSHHQQASGQSAQRGHEDALHRPRKPLARPATASVATHATTPSSSSTQLVRHRPTPPPTKKR